MYSRHCLDISSHWVRRCQHKCSDISCLLCELLKNSCHGFRNDSLGTDSGVNSKCAVQISWKPKFTDDIPKPLLYAERIRRRNQKVGPLHHLLPRLGASQPHPWPPAIPPRTGLWWLQCGTNQQEARPMKVPFSPPYRSFLGLGATRPPGWPFRFNWSLDLVIVIKRCVRAGCQSASFLFFLKLRNSITSCCSHQTMFPCYDY